MKPSQLDKIDEQGEKIFTKVFRGSEKADRQILKFITKTKTKIDCCISSSAPSVIIEVESIRNARIAAAKDRGIKIRYVTEITEDNLEYCKEMLRFSEIRHLEGMKGNFEVADKKEYVAVATLREAKPLPQLIFSNVPEVVEQQQFVFDSFWEKGRPAQQRIEEIQKGITFAVTRIITDYEEAESKEFDMIRKATKEIQIIYSTAIAFHLQEKSGVLKILKEKADQLKNLQISILVPLDSSIKKSLSHRLLSKTINNNIQIQDIAPSIDIKIKSLVVDRKEALVVELKHLRIQQTTASVGFTIYSNSIPTVLSYASIFEVIYNQSILFEQLKQEGNLKDEFINIAAHELRTPIMPVLNGLEMLEEKLGTRSEEFRKELDIITRNASRLQMLAEGILQVSRIESGSFTIGVEKDVNIHSIIVQVMEDIDKKYLYTDKLIGIEISFLPFDNKSETDDKQSTSELQPQITTKLKLKPTSSSLVKLNSHYLHDNQSSHDHINKNHRKDNENKGDKDLFIQKNLPLLVDCDSEKIRQVFFNLLDNAVKYTSKGKIVISTLVMNSTDCFNKDLLDHKESTIKNNTSKSENFESMKEENDKYRHMIIVSVKNQGKGIDPHIRDQVFEKFSTKSAQGTGLGLYLSKKIVEAHGGIIWCEEYDDSENNLFDDNNSVNYNSKRNNSFNTDERKITAIKFAIPISMYSNEDVLKS